MKLESKRLLIREIKISDASFYFNLFRDPDWIKFINDKKLKTVEETALFLKDFQLKQKKGLGYFTVILKATNKPIGVSTVLKRDALDFFDIGYGCLPIGRGKGYATEATKLIIEYVSSKFKQEKILAFTKPNNKGSQKLLKKLDFKYLGLQAVFGVDEDAVFELLV